MEMVGDDGMDGQEAFVVGADGESGVLQIWCKREAWVAIFQEAHLNTKRERQLPLIWNFQRKDMDGHES